MITKHDCSLYHAKQILNLTLTGIVNESSDQLGILYEYDANATHPAELANLAYDVLKAVPVLSSYHNSPTGSAPRIADRLVKKSMGELLAGIDWWNLKDWIDTIKEMWARLMSWFESLIEAFLDLLSDLVAFVLDAVQKVGEALGNLVQAVAEAGLTLVKAMAAAAMEVLENLLKAALLAMIYLEFAISLLIFGVIVGLFQIFGDAISQIISQTTSNENVTNNLDERVGNNPTEKDLDYNSKTSNERIFEEPANDSMLQLSINLMIIDRYDPFYDIIYPALNFTFGCGKFLFELLAIGLEIQVDITEDIFSSFDFNSSSFLNNTFEMLSNMGEVMTITGGAIAIHAVILEGVSDDKWDTSFIGGLILYVAGILGWLYLTLDDFLSFPVLLGIGLGFLGSAGSLFKLYLYLRKAKKNNVPKNTYNNYIQDFEESWGDFEGFTKLKCFSVIEGFLGALDLEFKLRDIVVEDENPPASQILVEWIMSMVAGFASQFVAAGSIIFFGGGTAEKTKSSEYKFKYKYKITKYYLVINTILGIISLAAAFTVALETNND